MSSLSRFQPDDIYCVVCHAPAAGPCATCRKLICADCGELTGGSVKKVVVCHACARRGRGEVGWKAWAALLWPWALVLAILTGLALAMTMWR